MVRFANLPNQQILPNALWTNNGRVANEHMDELMQRLSITKKIGTMSFTAGGYFGYAGISDRQSSGGRTASPLTEQPQPLGIRWIPATAATVPATATVSSVNVILTNSAARVLVTGPGSTWQTTGSVILGNTGAEPPNICTQSENRPCRKRQKTLIPTGTRVPFLAVPPWLAPASLLFDACQRSLMTVSPLMKQTKNSLAAKTYA